ncbi:cupin domain-containing protein [bacterium]|nr:cupin domain-containing protein [bacterium]
MAKKTEYSIHLDNKFGFLQLIDVNETVKAVTDPWFNQTLTQVNDCVVRLGVFKKGEFHWHKHDEEDEFFFVLEGEFILETEEEEIRLQPMQGYTIPKGVLHRTRVEQPAVILMMEGSGVQPTGN